MRDLKLKIKIIIPIIACIIVAAFGFYQGYNIEKLAYTMVAAAFIFYVLGIIIHYYLAKAIKKEIEEKKELEIAQKEIKQKEIEANKKEEKDKADKEAREKEAKEKEEQDLI